LIQQGGAGNLASARYRRVSNLGTIHGFVVAEPIWRMQEPMMQKSGEYAKINSFGIGAEKLLLVIPDTYIDSRTAKTSCLPEKASPKCFSLFSPNYPCNYVGCNRGAWCALGPGKPPNRNNPNLLLRNHNLIDFQ
jgi:hypothetical protein